MYNNCIMIFIGNSLFFRVKSISLTINKTLVLCDMTSDLDSFTFETLDAKSFTFSDLPK